MTTFFELSIWNFQELIRASVPTKRLSRNFDFGGLWSGQFWDLTIIRSWQNVHMPFCSESTSGNVLFISRYSYIRALSMARMQFWPNDLSFESLEVIWGHIRFLPLSFDRIEIERWGWSQCVSLAQTTRLIFNMIYLTSHVTSRDLDLRSNSDIPLLRSICAYFDAARREEHDTSKNMSLAFLVQKLFGKNRFIKKNATFYFLDLCSLNHWS